MASNYLNSAGTDLDNVFHVDNSNAGALGFLTSDNQDLGNRYPAGSLGVEVGYKTAAGTDIGYLRANIMPVEGTITNSVSNYNPEDSDSSRCETVDSNTTCRCYAESYATQITGTLTISNNMTPTEIKWILEGKSTSGTQDLHYGTGTTRLRVTADARCAGNAMGCGSCGKDCSGSSKRVGSSWVELVSVTNTNLSATFQAQTFRAAFRVRIKAVITNTAGTNTIIGPEHGR